MAGPAALRYYRRQETGRHSNFGEGDLEIADLLNELILGPKGIWLLAASLVLGLLMFRMTHALIYAVLGVAVLFFGPPLVPMVLAGAPMDEIGGEAGTILSQIFASPTNLGVIYLIYLALISIVYFVKSLVFAKS